MVLQSIPIHSQILFTVGLFYLLIFSWLPGCSVFIVTLTPLSPSLLCHPHITVTLIPLSPSLHGHPHSSVTLTSLSPLFLCHPHSTVTLTPLSPSLHCHPYSFVTLTPLSPSLLFHFQKKCTLNISLFILFLVLVFFKREFC